MTKTYHVGLERGTGRVECWGNNHRRDTMKGYNMQHANDKTIPLYATVSYSGNTWTVHYKAYGSTSNIIHTGYGVFPKDRFPNIPVIDYTNNDNVMAAIAIPISELPREVYRNTNGSIESYLYTLKGLGINVR